MNASARSVHSTGEVDLFPQGQISSDELWYLDDKITFTHYPIATWHKTNKFWFKDIFFL